MANPKFYYAPGACSLAPHILLHELNIPFTPIPNIINATTVSFTTGFEIVNPKLRVPVLVIGEEVITETPAVLVAICTLFGSSRTWDSVDEENGVEVNGGLEEGKGAQFLGRTPLEKIRVIEWMNWISGTLHAHAFGGLLRPWRLTDDVDAYDNIKKKGMENVREAFGVIERKFQIQIKNEGGESEGEGENGGKGEGSWAMGENFTVVDAYLFVFWRWGVGFGIQMKEEFPRYSGMVGRLVRRDGVRRALREEGIEVPV